MNRFTVEDQNQFIINQSGHHACFPADAIHDRAFWLNKKFVDNKKFPYGISRSGIFTFSQSQLLENKGSLLKALIEGRVSDPSAEDLAFISAIANGRYEDSMETLVWAKYQSYSRQFFTLGERPKKVTPPTQEPIIFDSVEDDDNWSNGTSAQSELMQAS